MLFSIFRGKRKPTVAQTMYGEMCQMRQEIDAKDSRIRSLEAENKVLRRRLQKYEPGINVEPDEPVEETTSFGELFSVENGTSEQRDFDDMLLYDVGENDGELYDTVYGSDSTAQDTTPEEQPKSTVSPLFGGIGKTEPLEGSSLG
jgi:hypothetical protein